MFTHSFTQVTPFARYDNVPWTLVRVEEAATADGEFTEIAAIAITPDTTPATPNPIDVTITTATLPAGWFRFRWDDGGATSPATEAIRSPAGSTAPFASLADLAARIGALTDEHVTRGTLLLDLATGIIADAVNRAAQDITPVPIVLRAVCLEMVARVTNNPTGARSESERLGEYQHTTAFADDAQLLTLTDHEARMCRRAVHGRLSGTSMPATTLDHVIELADTGEIAGLPAA